MKTAYPKAGVTSSDVDVSERHDCFTVLGAPGTGVFGKAEPGWGARFRTDGKAAVDDECAINTSGGFIARGRSTTSLPDTGPCSVRRPA
jgi:acetyl-CoA C-acetyltransferase